MARLVLALISGLIEEAVLAAVVLVILPRFGIQIPVWGLIGLMVLLAVNNTVFFMIGSRALRKGTLIGLPAMVGAEGEVVSSLSPRGLVKVRGELWQATSKGGEILVGEMVIVVGQDGLGLVVARCVQNQ
ncbi:MAG: NfeD family protein [Dehalococcoidales bacterium]|jgi:membrane-bound ClpP family serine protease